MTQADAAALVDEFERENDPQLEHLRRANARLAQQLAEAKASKAELVRAVYQAASDAISGLSLAPVKKPPADTRRRAGEVAIIPFADWQCAKLTQTYNTDVCEQRIEEYVDKAIKLIRIQRADHPVRSARLYLLGDFLEGEMIFPGQAHLIDASLYRQVVLDVPRILGNAVRRFLAEVESVHVDGAIGNHGALGGRARRDYHPESNADAMAYDITRQLLAHEKRLTWAPTFTPNERKWYSVDYVGSKGFLLFHGDQIKGGFAGFPWYGFAKKVMGWRMGAIKEPFDYALAGHFHTPTRMLIGNVTLWVSGSPESSNTYAAEMLAAQGTPSQWLLFCHPEKGVTAEYQVHLGAA